MVDGTNQKQFHIYIYPDRKCIECNKLEDEFHFMLECPLYNYIRKRYISKYYWKYANIPNCIQLLTSNNKEWNINMALFVQESFELKKTYYCY